MLLAVLQQVTLLEELAALAEVMQLLLQMSKLCKCYKQVQVLVQVQFDKQTADYLHKDLEGDLFDVEAFQLAPELVQNQVKDTNLS